MSSIDLGDQIAAVLDELNLDRIHLVGWASTDWGPMLNRHGNRVETLTLAFPSLRLGTPDAIDCPVLGFVSDQGNGPINTTRLEARASDVEIVEFAGYNAALWNDVIADNASTFEHRIRAFLDRHPLPNTSLKTQRGQVGGIHYSTQGDGPPIVVLPIGLVPSQWDSVIPALAENYSVISLGGAPLGMVATLESRAESGYGKVVATLISALDPKKSDRVLEVGCGPGSLVRALATRYEFAHPIDAVDINSYLMNEARALNSAAALDDRINVAFGNAEDLPFDDAQFDLLYCSTVLEEGHADAMLTEFKRVLKPGGRLAVAVRSTDVPWWVNMDGDAALRTRLNELAPRTSSGAGPGGCADASLYRRVIEAGFEDVNMRLQLAIYANDKRALEVRERLLAMLDQEDADRAADLIHVGENQGTFFIAEPFHGVTARR